MTSSDSTRRRTALITGGSRGIGLTTAHRFLADGYAVAVADVNPRALARLDDLAAEHGDAFTRLEMDITDSAQIQRALDDIVGRWGQLDVLVNNAGRNRGGRTFDTSEEDWDWVLDTNLKGSFLCSKLAAVTMRDHGGGSIINLSSTSAGGFDRNPAYDASKAGLIGLTRGMAHDLGEHGIRVNAVAPGTTLTDWVKHNLPEDFIAADTEATPLGTLAEPEDIAAAIAFLASEDARHITGQVLSVSGGRWMP